MRQAKRHTENGFEAIAVKVPDLWNTMDRALLATAILFPIMVVLALLVAIGGSLMKAEVDRRGALSFFVRNCTTQHMHKALPEVVQYLKMMYLQVVQAGQA